MYRIQKTGAQKKKPGRKRKADAELKYLAAKELKKAKVSEESNLDESMIIGNSSDEKTTSEAYQETLHGEEKKETEHTVELNRNEESSSPTIINLTRKVETAHDGQSLYSKGKKLQSYETHLGIRIMFPGMSQNSVNLPEGKSTGSNACVGFCLKTAEDFLKNKFSPNLEDAFDHYKSSLVEMVDRYEKDQIEMMDPKSTIDYFGYSQLMHVKKEIFWHTSLNVGGKDPMEVCTK